MQTMEYSKTIQIPEDVAVTIKNKQVTVKGAKGTVTRDFSHASTAMELSNKTIRVWAEWPQKKEAALVGTIHSHIKNMITGVQKGFTYKLKIVYSHFPMSVKVQDSTFLIENFSGERSARKAKILGNVKINIQGDDILVQGLNIEDVSQTAASIQQATKIKKKDPRIFLDGIYVYAKSEGIEE